MASMLPQFPRKVMNSPSCASDPCLTKRFFRSLPRSSISFAKPLLQEPKFAKSRHYRLDGEYKAFCFYSGLRHLQFRAQLEEANRLVWLCKAIEGASGELGRYKDYESLKVRSCLSLACARCRTQCSRRSCRQ
jgi:hypothetical protein